MLWGIQNHLRFFISSDLGQQVPQHDVNNKAIIRAGQAALVAKKSIFLNFQCRQQKIREIEARKVSSRIS
jgi:hypothetical protein